MIADTITDFKKCNKILKDDIAQLMIEIEQIKTTKKIINKYANDILEIKILGSKCVESKKTQLKLKKSKV